MDAYTKKALKSNLPVGLTGILVLILVIFDPVPQPYQRMLVIALSFVILVRIVYMQMRPKEDEVELAVWRFGSTIGVWIGILLSFISVVAVRYMPGGTELMVRLTSFSRNGLPESVIGFAFGVSLTIMLICLSMAVATVARALWSYSGEEK